MGTCKLFWLLGIVLVILEATKAGGEVGRQFRYRSCTYPVDKQSFLTGLLKTVAVKLREKLHFYGSTQVKNQTAFFNGVKKYSK